MAAGRAHVLTLAAALAGSVAVAGCGGGDGGGGSVAQAVGKTTSARSYRLAATTKMKLPGVARPVSVTGQGAFEPKASRGRMSLDLRDLTQLVGRPIGTAMLVLAGDVVYMRIPYLKTVQPSLKPWLKIDLKDAGRSRGIDFSSFLQFSQGGDPTATVQYLRAVRDVKKVGKEEIRGVETTHYRGSIELEKVPNTVPAKLRSKLRAELKELAKLTNQKTLPVEVWIDSSNYVRRMAYREAVGPKKRRTHLTITMDLYDFGAKVVAPVPAKGDVTDLTALSQG